MRAMGSVIVASSLIASSVFATTEASHPLTPGKPAGVKQAQSLGNNTLLLVLGLGVVAGGIALIASGNGNTTVGTTTTTSTTAP